MNSFIYCTSIRCLKTQNIKNLFTFLVISFFTTIFAFEMAERLQNPVAKGI